jgi:hypothetical protein
MTAPIILTNQEVAAHHVTVIANESHVEVYILIVFTFIYDTWTMVHSKMMVCCIDSS